MVRDYFRNLTFIDQNTFTELFDAWGYSHAACYRFHGKSLVFLMGSAPMSEVDWPATIDPVSLHYTDSKQDLLPFGWHKTKHKTAFGRNAIFYGPEQEGQISKILLVLYPRDIKKRVQGQLDGELEAFSKRFRNQMDQSETRHFFHQSLMAEHASKLSRDTKVLIDHEMRTPVSTISGYAHLLREATDPETQKVAEVIIDQVNALLASIEKLSFTVGAAFNDWANEQDFKQIHIQHLLEDVSKAVTLHVQSEISPKVAPNFKVVVAQSTPDHRILGSRDRLYRALWEVIHNAFIFAPNAEIQASLYDSGPHIIIDVKDNGNGIPKGCEDLIFMQFYKGQSDVKVRRGHRGLGLGLYLARHIIELHGGQLLLVGQAEKGALFRFLLPRLEHREVQKAV